MPCVTIFTAHRNNIKFEFPPPQQSGFRKEIWILDRMKCENMSLTLASCSCGHKPRRCRCEARLNKWYYILYVEKEKNACVVFN